MLNLPSAALADAVDRIALTTGRTEINANRRARGYVHVADKFALGGNNLRPSRLAAGWQMPPLNVPTPL